MGRLPVWAFAALSAGCGVTEPAVDWPLLAAAAREQAPVGERQVLDALEARVHAALSALPHPQDAESLARAASELRKRLAEAVGIGRLPAPHPTGVKAVGVIDRGDYVIEKIVYRTLPDTDVPVHLYRPARPVGKLPAVVFVPGHWWPDSKARPDFQSFCITLARRGFVVLSYDPVGQGERGISFRDHRRTELLPVGISQQAVTVFETLCALDYLLSRPEVDAARIGLTGASGGGYNTWIAGALEPRFAALAPVVGTSDFEEQIRVCRGLDFYQAREHCHYVPGLLQFANNHDLLALIAPRPLMIVSAEGDESFPAAGVRRIVGYGQAVYAALGRPLDVGYFEDSAEGHGYQKRKREAVYGWFLKHLKGEGDGGPFGEPPVQTVPFDAPEMRCFDGANRPAGPGIVAYANAAADSCAASRSRAARLGRRDYAVLLMVMLGLNFDDLLPDFGDALRAIARLGSLRHVFAGLLSPGDRKGRAWAPETGPVQTAGGRRVQRLRWRARDGVSVPAVMIAPASACRGALLAAADEGKESLLEDAEVRAAVEAGFAAVLADPRGMGELAVGKPGWVFATSLLLGENFVGRQACDLVAGRQALAELPELRGKPIAVLGRGPFAAMAALYAAVLDPHFAGLSHGGGFLTYRSFLERPESSAQSYRLAPTGVAGAYRIVVGPEKSVRDSYLPGNPPTAADREIPHALPVFGALAWFDLPDLFASLAPRPVHIIGAIDGDFRPLPDSMVPRTPGREPREFRAFLDALSPAPPAR